jgi:ABC-type branched-subunit amino acid transport system substrate-binding protein
MHAAFHPQDVRADLLQALSKPEGLRLGVTANNGAHTNELIGGVVLAAEDHHLPLSISWCNDGRDPMVARAAAATLVQKGVAAVIGHLSASAALTAAEIYAAAHVTFLAPGTTHPDLTAGGSKTIFRVCGREQDAAEELLRLVARLPHHDVVAVIQQDIPYGRALGGLVHRTALAAGMGCVSFIAHGDSLGSRQLEELERAQPDALIIAGIHEFAAPCCRQLRAAGVRAPLLLGDDCFTPNLLALGGECVEGALLVVPGPCLELNAKSLELVERYRRAVGSMPGAYFLTSYMAAWLLLTTCARTPGARAAAIAEDLHRLTFETPIGRVSFDEHGEINGLGWTTYSIRHGGFVREQLHAHV